MTFEATERGSTSTFTKRKVSIYPLIIFLMLVTVLFTVSLKCSPQVLKHVSLFLHLPSSDHSRILLPLDELDRKTWHNNISVFTKWEKERNISDVIH